MACISLHTLTQTGSGGGGDEENFSEAAATTTNQLEPLFMFDHHYQLILLLIAIIINLSYLHDLQLSFLPCIRHLTSIAKPPLITSTRVTNTHTHLLYRLETIENHHQGKLDVNKMMASNITAAEAGGYPEQQQQTDIWWLTKWSSWLASIGAVALGFVGLLGIAFNLLTLSVMSAVAGGLQL